MSFEWIMQQAIFARLHNGADLASASVGVYDEVPQAQEFENAFPFIVIGDDQVLQWDTNTELGAEIIATLHTWSRYAGKKETKTIQAMIYTALHRTEFVITGYSVALCVWQDSKSFLDADGATRHGVQTFKILIEKI